MKTLRFYKEEDNTWYADIPDYICQGGEKADLQMVAGADNMLDILSNNGDSITLRIYENNEEPEKYVVSLWLLKEDEIPNYNCNINGYEFSIWLCGVTKWLYGYYPEVLYINKVNI